MPGIDWLNAFLARRKTLEKKIANRTLSSEINEIQIGLWKDKLKSLDLAIQILETDNRTYSRLEEQFFVKCLDPWRYKENSE